MAQMAYLFVVICDGAFVTAQLVFDCVDTKYFMTIHRMPGTKHMCDIRYALQLFVRINDSRKHFFNRKCYVNARPDIMQGWDSFRKMKQRRMNSYHVN
jgi:hypothetical protein